ncbi:MAG: dienelactone hydrolase family protein [Actinomycetota bacterium]
MCFETTARPPLPPIAGGARIAGSEWLVLEASDGNRFNAFSARAADLDAPGIMILPDVRGLHPFYEDLAKRFAEAGVHATAMDYFGRTAGLGDRNADFDFMAHVQQITEDGMGADTAATLAHIRSEAGGGAQLVYSVGFCMGGRISFNQAWRDQGLAGVIGFYGGPQGKGPDDDTAPVRLASQYRCPVLGLFGGADESIPPEAIDEFRRALDGAGVTNEMVVYDGAPHSFFDRKFEEHREACDDAWLRMLRFVGRSV